MKFLEELGVKWISIKERKPTERDSPILAFNNVYKGCFLIAALEYKAGWDGKGWYDHSGEYGIGLNEDEAHFNENAGMTYWMPLPSPPKEKE